MTANAKVIIGKWQLVDLISVIHGTNEYCAQLAKSITNKLIETNPIYRGVLNDMKTAEKSMKDLEETLRKDGIEIPKFKFRDKFPFKKLISMLEPLLQEILVRLKDLNHDIEIIKSALKFAETIKTMTKKLEPISSRAGASKFEKNIPFRINLEGEYERLLALHGSKELVQRRFASSMKKLFPDLDITVNDIQEGSVQLECTAKRDNVRKLCEELLKKDEAKIFSRRIEKVEFHNLLTIENPKPSSFVLMISSFKKPALDYPASPTQKYVSGFPPTDVSRNGVLHPDLEPFTKKDVVFWCVSKGKNGLILTLFVELKDLAAKKSEANDFIERGLIEVVLAPNGGFKFRLESKAASGAQVGYCCGEPRGTISGFVHELGREEKHFLLTNFHVVDWISDPSHDYMHKHHKATFEQRNSLRGSMYASPARCKDEDDSYSENEEDCKKRAIGVFGELSSECCYYDDDYDFTLLHLLDQEKAEVSYFKVLDPVSKVQVHVCCPLDSEADWTRDINKLIGCHVFKYGATTSYTCGIVTGTSLSPHRTLSLIDQEKEQEDKKQEDNKQLYLVICRCDEHQKDKRFTEGGDSGSLILTRKEGTMYIIGQHRLGDTESENSYALHIHPLLDKLENYSFFCKNTYYSD